MALQPPSELTPFEVLFDRSEPNAALSLDLTSFLGNVGFPPPAPDRPWVFANFVQTIDGLVSFGGNRPGGEWISRSRHDRWMMDLLRAHADAVLCGSGTLKAEAEHGRIPGGPVYRIVQPELLHLRDEVLQRGRQRNIIVSGTGDLHIEQYRLFRSEHVEPWIATTPQGRRRLGDTGNVRIVVSGSGALIDWPDLLQQLRREHGMEYLLCEGGPTLYSEMARAGCIDEKFLTVSPQEIGAGLPEGEEPKLLESPRARRPTSFFGPGLSVERALWYRWMSCRKAGEHEFNRYRRTTPPPE